MPQKRTGRLRLYKPAPDPKAARSAKQARPEMQGGDPEAKRMLVIARNRGLVEAEVRSNEAASVIGRHHHAVRLHLEDRGDEPLKSLARTRLRLGGEGDEFDTDPETVKKLGGAVYELECDLESIEDLAHAGDLGYDEIYVIR